MAGYDASTNGKIIGIAKDGHVIYGPKDSNGDQWTCDDMDFCNGKVFDDGHYAYLSTLTFPYTVGCWGPAASLKYAPTCSTNVCEGTMDEVEDN